MWQGIEGYSQQRDQQAAASVKDTAMTAVAEVLGFRSEFVAFRLSVCYRYAVSKSWN